MSNNQFRKPLIQSAVVLAILMVFILFVSSAHPTSFFGGIGAIFIGILKTILFIIGLSIGLAVAIGILIAIFFAGLKFYDSQLSAKLYSEFKERFFATINECKDSCTCECSDKKATVKIEVEELDNIKADLRASTSQKLTLMSSVDSLKEEVAAANTEANSLNATISQLTDANKELTDELKAANENGAELTQKLQEQESANKTLEKDRDTLEKTFEKEKAELETQIAELEANAKELETELDKAPEAAIFSYMDNDEDKEIFIEKIDEALEFEMTYAQIDEYLSQELEEDLDKIVKDHPTLTKNYIRNKRRELENN